MSENELYVLYARFSSIRIFGFKGLCLFWGLSAHGQMRKHLDDPGGTPAAEVADDREPGPMPGLCLPRSDGRQPVILNLMTNQKTRNAKFVSEVIQCFFAHYPRATQATAQVRRRSEELRGESTG